MKLINILCSSSHAQAEIADAWFRRHTFRLQALFQHLCLEHEALRQLLNCWAVCQLGPNWLFQPGLDLFLYKIWIGTLLCSCTLFLLKML